MPIISQKPYILQIFILLYLYGTTRGESECQNTCGWDQFQCESSCLCIPLSRKCDGRYDCHHKDLSDEINEVCENGCRKNGDPGIECGLEMDCVANVFLCDGDIACPNGEDESELLCHCPKGYNEEPGGKKCIPDQCTQQELVCAGPGDTTLCVNKMQTCDGVENCRGGEDEGRSCSDCGNKGKDYYTCGDYSGCYMDEVWNCNGIKDCISGRDENTQNCPSMGLADSEKCYSNLPHYRIQDAYRCDGIKHCENGRDELSCETRENNVECHKGTCDHSCNIERSGGFSKIKCSCEPGFYLAEDGHTCFWDIRQDATMIALNKQGELVRFSLSEDDPKSFRDTKIISRNLSAESRITGVAKYKSVIYFDFTEDGTLPNLVLHNWETGAKETIFSKMNHENVDDLVFDWVHNLLYWTEWDPKNSKSTIKTTPLDPSVKLVNTGKRKVYTVKMQTGSDSEDTSRVKSLAIHPKKGQIFLARWNNDNTGFIQTAWQDGSDAKILINSLEFYTLRTPDKLKIDYISNELYFIAENGKTVNKVSLGFQDTSKLSGEMVLNIGAASQQTQRALDLTLFSNNLFYSEETRPGIYMISPLNMFNADEYPSVGTELVKKVPDEHQLTSIIALHPSTQIESDNIQCFYNKDCNEAQCFPQGTDHYSCFCEDDSYMDRQKICKTIISPFAVVSEKSSLGIYTLDGKSIGTIFGSDITVTADDFSHDDEYVYWVDSIGQQKMSRFKADNFSDISDVFNKLEEPLSIAIDHGPKLIYWTDGSRNTIEVANIDGSHPNVLLTRDDKPKSLKLDLLNGRMMWIEGNSRILGADMDGSDVREITNVYQKNCVLKDLNFDMIGNQIIFSCTFSYDELFKIESPSQKSGPHAPIRLNVPSLFNLKYHFTIYGRSLVTVTNRVNSVEIYDPYNPSREVEIDDTNMGEGKAIEIFNQPKELQNSCENNPCEQRCLRNSKKSGFSCACYFGFERNEKDLSKCVPRKDSPVLLISHEQGVKALFLEDERPALNDLPLPRKTRVALVDFDPLNLELYYLESDVYETVVHPIRSVDIYTGELKQEYGLGLDITAFVLDSTARKLYYAESLCSCIKVTELGNPEKTYTLTRNQKVGKVYKMLVDNQRGFLFWTQEINSRRSLQRIDLDGNPASRIEISAKEVVYIYDVPQDFTEASIDVERTEVFYNMDGKVVKHDYLNFKGSANSSNVHVHNTVSGLTFLNDIIYSGSEIDVSHSNILTTDLIGNAKILINKAHMKISSMKGFNFETSRRKRSPCENKNGYCESKMICLTNSESYSCLCPDGIQRGKSGKECNQYPESFLLLPKERVFMPNGEKDFKFVFEQFNDPTSLDVLFSSQQIFIGTEQNGIFRMDFNKNKVTQILDHYEACGEVQQIAVDWLTGQIFWTTPVGLFVSQSNGNLVKQLYPQRGNYNDYCMTNDRINLGGLAVHPFMSYLFFADYNNKKIYRMYTDGSSKIKILDYVVTPNSMKIDFNTDRLYWSDIGRNIIESCDESGKQRAKIVDRNTKDDQIYAMTIHNSTLYYTGSVTKTSPDFFVKKCDLKKSSQECETIYSGENGSYKSGAIAYVDKNSQPMDSIRCGSLCDTRKKQLCDDQHLCLSKTSQVTCACSDRSKIYNQCSDRSVLQNACEPSSENQQKSTGVPPDEYPDPKPNPPTFEDFEVKLVMIVLVIIAVVVIILMIAILLLIRRHMIAAPPSCPTPRAVFNPAVDQVQLVLTSHPPTVSLPPRSQETCYNPPPNNNRTIQFPKRPSQQNPYVLDQPYTMAPHFDPTRPKPGGHIVNFWTPTPQKRTNIPRGPPPPPPYSATMSPNLHSVGRGGIRPPRTMGMGMVNPNWNFARMGPQTFSENSSEDLHQHSNDDSSSA